MSVEITIRHVKLSVALQSAARKKAEKLGAGEHGRTPPSAENGASRTTSVDDGRGRTTDRPSSGKK